MKNIILISAADLEKQGTITSDKNYIVFNNSTFKRGVAFNLTDKEKIIESYKLKSQDNIKYILVEDKFTLTVWSEYTQVDTNKVPTMESSSINQETFQDQASSFDNTAPSQNNTEATVATKKIVKKYRGQTYEIVIPDVSSSQEINSQQEKKRLKYRGKYID